MNRVFIAETKQNVVCNIYLQYLIKSKKGSRIFYDILVGVNEYIPQAKWTADRGYRGRGMENVLSNIKVISRVKTA